MDSQTEVARTGGTPSSVTVTSAVPAVSVPVSKDAVEKAGETWATVRADIICNADAAKSEVYVCFEGPLGAHLKQEVRDKIDKCRDFFPIAVREV